jgi:hypothetical protein
VTTRLRRADPRSGWLIAVGGAFLTTAVAFSFASGIFHPYYVSLLDPFTAALVGAGAAELSGRRVLAPVAVAAGVVGELVVLHDNSVELGWLVPVLAGVGVVAAVALARGGARIRATALTVVLGALLIAPAGWAVRTLGHPTSGTFPAGGPAEAAMGGHGGRPGMRGGPPPGFAGGTRPAGPPPAFGRGGPTGGFGGRGPGRQSLAPAIATYVAQHGGGTIAVSSQQGASPSIIDSNADVVALGGFSGRESQVSVSWLAYAVQAGKIRWVVADSGRSGPGADGRVGSKDVMTAVAASCKKTSASGGTLYDCGGFASALRAYAAQ